MPWENCHKSQAEGVEIDHLCSPKAGTAILAFQWQKSALCQPSSVQAESGLIFTLEPSLATRKGQGPATALIVHRQLHSAIECIHNNFQIRILVQERSLSKQESCSALVYIPCSSSATESMTSAQAQSEYWRMSCKPPKGSVQLIKPCKQAQT